MSESATPLLIFILIAIGLGMGMSLLGRKLPSMSASIQLRVWGIAFLSSGVMLFLIGQLLPKGFPMGIAAWILQLMSIYLGFFLGILINVRGE